MAGVALLPLHPLAHHRRVASETMAMAPDRSKARRCLIIERRYVSSRLAADLMAAAYESVVPVLRQTISGASPACEFDSAEHRELKPGQRTAIGA